MKTTDTIFALSTAAGVSAVAILRLSGPRVWDVLDSLTGHRVPIERRFAVRQLRNGISGDILDVAGVLWMPGPSSFTGQDCAELHVHGSQAVISAVIRVLSGFVGLRLAEAGEFTRRAFVNGKLDLVEVEGLGDLLAAKTESQRRLALGQVLGRSSSKYSEWRRRLVEILALVEAAVDFSEEEDVTELAAAQAQKFIEAVGSEMNDELAASSSVELLREGVRVALVGKPNTGKSSLLNAVVRREAALVSPLAGTTRDVIEVSVEMGGIQVILTDMAGLRENTSDQIEVAGIDKARREIAVSDVVVWVCSPDVEDSMSVDEGVRPDILVLGKSDLEQADSILLQNDSGRTRFMVLSATTGSGLAEFVEAISDIARVRVGDVESSIVSTARQREVLVLVGAELDAALVVGLDRLELKAEHIRRAAEGIARITGRIEVEDLLGEIFNRFCIGK